MKLSLTTSGLLDPKRLDSWIPEKRRAIRKAVEAGMKSAGREIAQTLQARMQFAFKVRKAGFVRSMRHKLYAGSPAKFPALMIGSRIPWLGIHTRGGTIGGRMLIPLLPEHQRLGRKAFRRVIDGLMRTGNAFFIQKNGKVILMAEVIKENAAELRRFKRAERRPPALTNRLQALFGQSRRSRSQASASLTLGPASTRRRGDATGVDRLRQGRGTGVRQRQITCAHRVGQPACRVLRLRRSIQKQRGKAFELQAAGRDAGIGSGALTARRAVARDVGATIGQQDDHRRRSPSADSGSQGHRRIDAARQRRATSARQPGQAAFSTHQ